MQRPKNNGGLTNVAAANHFVEARCARILLDVLAAELERLADNEVHGAIHQYGGSSGAVAGRNRTCLSRLGKLPCSLAGA